MQRSRFSTKDRSLAFLVLLVVLAACQVFFWSWGSAELFHRMPNAGVESALKKSGKRLPPSPDEIGWYILAATEPIKKLDFVLSNIRRFYPTSPITLLSDSGTNFSTVCDRHRCRFVYSTEKVGADYYLHSKAFTCKKCVGRMVEATQWAGTPWMILAETDTRVLGNLRQAPTGDVMQMGNVNRCVKPQILQLIKSIFDRPFADGFSTTGGLLYRSQALIDAFEHQSIHNTALWRRAVEIEKMFDKTEDMCIYATMLLSGYEIKQWTEYMQAGGGWDCHDHVSREPYPLGKNVAKCQACIQDCQKRHCTPCVDDICGDLYNPVHECIYSCYCPTLWHNIKKPWCSQPGVYLDMDREDRERSSWTSRKAWEIWLSRAIRQVSNIIGVSGEPK